MSWSTPVTHAVGDVLTASDWNIDTSDLEYLYGDTTWSTPTLINSWTNQGGYTTQYRRVGTAVVLRGAVVGGASNSSAFTLPVGYRPAARQNFASIGGSAGVSVTVDTAGDVYVDCGSTGIWVALDPVTAWLI